MEEAGVEFDERLVVESGMWHRSDGVRVMNALLDSGVVPDGVVALNDMLASGVMHAIQMHNLRIPEDISVIGFDNSDDSQYLSPALTSIAPGLEAVARLSVKLLKDRIDGVSPSKDLKPEQKVFRKVSSSLVVRQSTKLPTNSLVVCYSSFLLFLLLGADDHEVEHRDHNDKDKDHAVVHRIFLQFFHIVFIIQHIAAIARKIL